MKYYKKGNINKKIGIITYHDGINYGAFFQAYSFFQVLRNVFNFDVEFINYKSFRHWFLEYLVFYHRFYNLEYFKDNIIKICKFRRLQSNIKKSNKIIFRQQLKNKTYDCIFYGSDEIWNYENILVGYDPVYFGCCVNATKISYASSFGSLDSSIKLSEDIINNLSSFKNISVRDKNSQKIIFNNLNKEAQIVLDPTLLINEIVTPILPEYNNFILVYTAKLNNRTVKSIREFAKRKGKQLISVGYRYSWCDRSCVNIGPQEWLGFYKKADYVITTMFHGTIYAIKYRKNFVSIVTKYRKNKIINFLKQVKLEDRILYKSDRLGKILSKKPNYKDVFRIISRQKIKSLEFINNSLKK